MRSWCWALLLLSGCGYQAVTFNGTERALAIPFVKGDRTGSLTLALHEAAVRAGFYVDRHAPHSLSVHVGPYESVDIGRIYERTPSGCLTDITVPNEGRLSLKAEMRLLDLYGRTLGGPWIIDCSQDYDFQSDLSQTLVFESQGQLHNVIRFGRGQLDFYAASQDAAAVPLEKKLSHRMMEVLRTHLLKGCYGIPSRSQLDHLDP